MRNFVLALFVFMTVGNFAATKEVTVNTVKNKEITKEVIEKPIIVYRDREVTEAPTWKPKGFFKMEYKYYGSVERQTPKDRDWSGNDVNYGRLETRTIFQFTKNQGFDIRTRHYSGLKSGENGPGAYDWNSETGGMNKFNSTTIPDEIRVRYRYNLGDFGNTKINYNARGQYQQIASKSKTKNVAVMLAFDFAKVFPMTDYFKVKLFEIKGIYIHQWYADGTPDENHFGIDLESEYILPFGFSAEFNLINRFIKHRRNVLYTNSGSYDHQFKSIMELYLRNSTNLYKKGKFSVDFVFEGGYEPYLFFQRKIMKVAQQDYNIGNYTAISAGETLIGTPQRRSYFLYAEPAFKVSYKPHDLVDVYAAVGATYGNFGYTTEANAKNWRWQPRAWAGIKIIF